MDSVYIQLFLTFFKIGLFGFGGGYAMISLIQHDILSHHWLTQSELTDIIAISQSTPGPIGLNCATYVGFTATGSIWGAVIATVAMILPSLIIMLCICKFLMVSAKNKYIEYALSGLRPTIIGLIGAAALFLVNTENFIDYKSILIFIAGFIMSFRFKVHPIIIIVVAGILGVILY